MFGFIGAGNIVTAILTGVSMSGEYDNAKIGVYDVNKGVVDKYSALGYRTYNSITELVGDCKVVVIAVTPQMIRSIVEELKGASVIVSLVAGITIEWLSNNLGSTCTFFRCMPTLAAQEQLGSFALSHCHKATDEQINKVTKFFSSCGVVENVEEQLMSKVVALNGSAPGYFYYLSRIVVEEAVRMGFDENTARRLFAQSMKGSAQTILNSTLSLEQLENKIKVHGGTTFAALDAMQSEGLENCVVQGLRACVNRSEELGRL
ncbi:MAG: hypothetical protein BEN18_02925 [Epulopiscium sp. Nuni2H_MBin001]|nr:MAG: hypothetical protein BEN18_02925 [Epulopiscium sp. Nuni2H_MBin001]